MQIITNLYPLPWEPNRAAFNRQQFQHLSKRCSVRIIVLVGWLASLGKNLADHPVEDPASPQQSNPEISFLRYFYIPAIARFTHTLTLALSLLLVRARIKQQQPDCLFLSWAFPDGVAGMMLAGWLGIPAVIKVHGSDVNMHCEHRLRARQIRWAMDRSSAVITVSQALADRLSELGVAREKIKTIYNGVDHTVFFPRDEAEIREELGVNPNRSLILFIGNLKLEKGCVDLVEAFTRIADKCPEADLCYIGSGKEEQAIRTCAQAASLESRVTLLGSLDHQVLCKWINASTLVALPSYNEGVPNVLLEAMTCGKPVVATKVGGIPEVVQAEAGILVPARNVDDLGAALVEALDRNWDAEAICQSVSNFSWDRNVDEVHQLLETAVSGSSH